MQGPAEAAAPSARHPSGKFAGGDVGEHVGVAGEGDDRPRPVVVGGQHVDAAVGGREPAIGSVVEDRCQRVGVAAHHRRYVPSDDPPRVA